MNEFESRANTVGHTPGPWRVDGTVRTEDGRALYDRDRTAAENAANAHLIAAAPDLLAALRELDSAVGSTLYDRLVRARGVAQAAIAKAEGRA